MEKKRPYLAVNVPSELESYFEEALTNMEIRKKLDLGNFTKTYSGLGCWIISEWLLNNTSYRFQHFNTYEDHITIIDNKTKRMINLTPKLPNKLCCGLCESENCEHVAFVKANPDLVKKMEKKGWKL